jgi:hypothetical protein
MSGLRIGTFNTQLTSVIFTIAHNIKFLGFKAVVPPLAPLALDDLMKLYHKHTIETKHNAELIADRILNGMMPTTSYRYDYDVIVLNEVFSEDARNILLNHGGLKATYPYRIGRLPDRVLPVPDFLFDGFFGDVYDVLKPLLDFLKISLPDTGEDSGLMLFSRYPIGPVHFEPFKFKSNGEMVDALPDSLASKGAAFLKISKPITGETFNLVLTHLQENKDEWVHIRTNQLKQIESLIRKEMTESMIKDSEIFVVGDLNIIGNWNEVGPLPKPPEDIINDLKRKGNEEWEYHFNDPASFFTETVHDTWFYETSTKDKGPRTGVGLDNRLDYILHNPKLSSNIQWKVQHLTKAFNLFTVEHENPSDHIGMNADLNRYAPHCNPVDAIGVRHKSERGASTVIPWIHGIREIKPEIKVAFKKEEFIHNRWTTLKYPGSVVWHRIDEPGAYSIAVLGEIGAKFMIYHNSDLSLPLGQYKDETNEITPSEFNMMAPLKFISKKYVMVDPPYYIQVYHPDRAVTGDYALYIHKHRGVSPNDAIPLLPHKEEESPDVGWFPIHNPLNPEDTVWFEFHTLGIDRVYGRVPQDISCEVSSYSEPVFRMTLYEEDEITHKRVEVSRTGPAPSKMTLNLTDEGPTKRYIAITRDEPTQETNKFNIKWTTNLTVLHGLFVDRYPIPYPKKEEIPVIPSAIEPVLKCENLCDPENGPDDIIMKIWVDGNPTPIVAAYLGEFTTDSKPYSLTHLIPPYGIRYLSKLEIQIWEGDSGSDDDPSDKITIPELNEYRVQPWDKSGSGYFPVFDFQGGLYSITLNRSSYLPSN